MVAAVTNSGDAVAMSLCGHGLHLLLGVDLGVGFLRHMVTLCSAF